MKLDRFALPVLALTLGLPGAVVAQGPPPPGYMQGQGGWDRPPQAYTQIQRRGFSDGIDGARKDIANHRRPDVNNRDEYRHPSVSGARARRTYREAFRNGYNMAISHMMSGPRPR